jgi:hypothetical protein
VPQLKQHEPSKLPAIRQGTGIKLTKLTDKAVYITKTETMQPLVKLLLKLVLLLKEPKTQLVSSVRKQEMCYEVDTSGKCFMPGPYGLFENTF